MGRRVVDLCGMRFGKLQVLKLGPDGDSGKRWICRCDCGQSTIVYGVNLKSGSIESCGCGRIKHGMSRTKLHHVWRTMKDRCNNPNANQYEDYGGRGIKYCHEWADFSNFFADMGHPPNGGTLERKDNNGPYCKDNCRWSTRREQARNKRNNQLVTWKGETLTVTDLAIKNGMVPRTLFNRLFRAKMSLEDAMNTPIQKKGGA